MPRGGKRRAKKKKKNASSSSFRVSHRKWIDGKEEGRRIRQLFKISRTYTLLPLINDRLIVVNIHTVISWIWRISHCAGSVFWSRSQVAVPPPPPGGYSWGRRDGGSSGNGRACCFATEKKRRRRSFWQIAEGGREGKGAPSPSRSHLLSRMDDIDKQEEWV